MKQAKTRLAVYYFSHTVRLRFSIAHQAPRPITNTDSVAFAASENLQNVGEHGVISILIFWVAAGFSSIMLLYYSSIVLLLRSKKKKTAVRLVQDLVEMYQLSECDKGLLSGWSRFVLFSHFLYKWNGYKGAVTFANT